MRLRCIIADDEPLACRLMASYVERTENLILCGAYTSASQALDAIRRQKPELVFLDIQMPGTTGLDIARNIAPPTRVVFTTAYRDYAVEGFRVNALDYLLKPVSYDEFTEAVERAMKSAAPEECYISVKSEYRLVRINVNDILYIEGLKDYIKIHIAGQQRPVLTLMSMKAAQEALPAERFMRVHRSFIANIGYIKTFGQSFITCTDGQRIPVSDSYRAEVAKHFGI